MKTDGVLPSWATHWYVYPGGAPRPVLVNTFPRKGTDAIYITEPPYWKSRRMRKGYITPTFAGALAKAHGESA